jgi:hypothetical protein
MCESQLRTLVAPRRISVSTLRHREHLDSNETQRSIQLAGKPDRQLASWRRAAPKIN